jgi:hypothetical protein
MKLIVACVFTNSGIAKESQKPYSMTRAVVLVPFRDVENSNFQSRGEGFSSVEMSVDTNFSTSFQNQFHTSFKGVPIQMDLTTSLDRESKNIIVGFEKVS